jgi:hypothetical protein
MASVLKSYAKNPTADEVKAARAILSAADKGGSKKDQQVAAKKIGTAMTAFIKSLKDVSEEDKQLTLSSRGPERESFNLLYLIRQARQSNTKKYHRRL